MDRSMLWGVLVGAALVAFAALVLRSYRKRLREGCCGAGGDGDERPVRVADKNRAHYPYAVQLVVDGMVCGGCKARVENALNRLPGVWASADVSARTVLVRLKNPPDEALLRRTVNEIGAYTVMEVRASSAR